jgi:DNA-binding XRE family transcriptional regulator
MATYRILPNEAARRRRATVPSPLLCEQCSGVLGRVCTVEIQLQLTAAAVMMLWPELRDEVKRHERECPGASCTHSRALTNAERFAANLRELREAAGLTRQELAYQAKMFALAIAFLESGARGPQWETLLALCAALGVELSAFARDPAALPKRRKQRRR